MRSRWCYLVLSLGAAGAISTSASGCIPDPRGDYENYTERTEGFRAGPGDASAPDTAPPTTAVESVYYTVCVASIAARNLNKALHFYTETKFTPDAAGGTGKLTLKLTALKVGHPTISKEHAVGETYTVTDTPTNGVGVYAAALGTVTIPALANAIGGRDSVVTNTTVPGRFARDRYCSQLTGFVVALDTQLKGEENTCLYVEVKDGAPTPPLTIAEFPETCVLQ